MLTSTWNISILPAPLLVWMKMLIHSLPLGATFGAEKSHMTTNLYNLEFNINLKLWLDKIWHIVQESHRHLKALLWCFCVLFEVWKSVIWGVMRVSETTEFIFAWTILLMIWTAECVLRRKREKENPESMCWWFTVIIHNSAPVTKMEIMKRGYHIKNAAQGWQKGGNGGMESSR